MDNVFQLILRKKDKRFVNLVITVPKEKLHMDNTHNYEI